MGFYIRSRGRFEQLRQATLLAAQRAIAGAFRPDIAATLEELRAWIIREYRGLARREWKKISPRTRALSRGREGAAITSLKQLESAARRALPLIDTGETLRSFNQGHPLNLYEIGNLGGSIGSRSPILAKHQKEHTATFIFGRPQAAALARNVPPRVTRGRGQKWNRLYFELRTEFRRTSGRSYSVPARPLPTKPDPRIVRKLQRRLALRLASMIRGAHRV